MIKKVWLSILAVAFLTVGLSFGSVMGQDEEELLLTINMTGIGPSRLTIGMEGMSDSRLTINQVIVIQELVGLRVYPVSCSFGLLRPGDIRSTAMAFTIYNASNVTVNATISVGGDWAGASSNWTHSDECSPGVNTAGLRAIVEDANGHTSIIVRKSEPYNNIVTNLVPGQRVSFALEIYAPTEFSDYSTKENAILVTVSAG